MANPSLEDTQRPLLHPTAYEEFKDWNNSAVEEHKILFFVIPVYGFIIGIFSKFELNQRNILLLKVFVVIILFYGASFMVMLRHTTHSRPDLSAFLHNISLFVGTLAFVPEALVVSMPLGWAILTLWGIILVCYLILKLVHLNRDSVKAGGANTSSSNNSRVIAIQLPNLKKDNESRGDARYQSVLDHNNLGQIVHSMSDEISDGSSEYEAEY